MLTRAKCRRRLELVCAPRVESLEERWLLHAALPLLPWGVPALSPPAPLEGAAVQFARPSAFLAGRATEFGPPEWSDHLGAPSGRTHGARAVATGTVEIVVFSGTATAGGFVIRDAVFFREDWAPRPFTDGFPDLMARHRADAEVFSGPRYDAPPAADAESLARDSLAHAAALVGPVGRAVAADRAAVTEPVPTALVATLSTRTGTGGAAQGQEGAGPGVVILVSSAGPSAALAASLGAALSPRLRGDAGGAAGRGLGEGPADAAARDGTEEVAGSRGVAAAGAVALTLPQVEGLLTQGMTFGAAALGHAVQALAEPLQTADGGPANALYWLGCSAWLLAAALACEGARRCRPRRPAEVALAAGPSDPPPEADL